MRLTCSPTTPAHACGVGNLGMDTVHTKQVQTGHLDLRIRIRKRAVAAQHACTAAACAHIYSANGRLQLGVQPAPRDAIPRLATRRDTQVRAGLAGRCNAPQTHCFSALSRSGTQPH